MSKPIKNIGIFAHADAGKTSITEHYLLAAGLIKSLGSVDNQSSFSDNLPVEKERGISVRSSYLNFEIENININLVDTPGHVDFSSEVERSLRVIDGAVLIISAVEGLQAHTETIWQALNERKIPTIIFINKIDRIGADSSRVIKEIKSQLTSSLAVLNETDDEGKNSVSVNSLFNVKLLNDNILELLSDFNNEMMERFLYEKDIAFSFAENILIKAVQDTDVFPVIIGSAKFKLGINLLIDSTLKYLPNAKGRPNCALSALVFALKNEAGNSSALVKVFNGTICNKELVKNYSQNSDQKVNLIVKQKGGKKVDIGKLVSGDIAEITGLKDIQIGDILGEPSEAIPDVLSLKTPLLTVQIKAENIKDYANLANALHILSSEDPTLAFEWLKEEQELHLKIMGWMQMQILERQIKDRFNIIAKFENPSVIYKETPAGTGEGFVQYWMPKPCWAIMTFKIEPGESGSGVKYISRVSVDNIHQKYQNEVERTIPYALKQGIKGWEVTDIKISLIKGEDHQVHSNPGDFVVATPMGIMQGLKEVGTKLLEPVISFKITAPEELLGKITSNIIQMRGSFDSPEIENKNFIIKGKMPLATSIEYPVKLSSRSGGKAKISTSLHSYEPCADQQGVIREYKGISPLDTAKYILKARKALQ